MFGEVWVNTKSDEIGKLAVFEEVGYHKRPGRLADNNATSEDFVYEFLKRHARDFLIQIHSIASLLTANDMKDFTHALIENRSGALLSVENIQIECAFHNQPINFSYASKTNSQELEPIQRITWSFTSWKRDNYIQTYENRECATYSGTVDYFAINNLAALVIKNQEDLDFSNTLFDMVHNEG